VAAQYAIQRPKCRPTLYSCTILLGLVVSTACNSGPTVRPKEDLQTLADNNEAKLTRWTNPIADREAEVDQQGILRWKDNGQEVACFGVNYCLPSCTSYRMVKRVGASHDKTIEQDISHFARMGLDGLRLSFWGDWQSSDPEGNLLDNEHLRLLDYVIYQAKKRGMYVVLTPITWYNPVWPEPEELNTYQGFSRFFRKKEQMVTDPNAIKAQVNYLNQIMRHVNRYAGLAYKDEPAILAVELINEPWSPASAQEVEKYINSLVKAIRDTGCTKPLFYNASQDMGIASAIRDSNVNGCTFGWYPTDLLAGRSLTGNFLPNLDDYPLMRDSRLATKAKLVYEFDAADIAGSCMYPAMARTFRTAGAQFAAMFTYDPLPTAPTNIEFQTHYLNLVYTPNKAVSLIIAAEVFRCLPRLKSYGKYPENTKFGPFRVDYEQDVSEMITEHAFLYSNNTATEPPTPGMLQRIVGCGSSPVVDYEGTGCYFLDKLEPGVWRLEVYPDAVWVNDPYGKPRLDREVSRILWRQWPMKICLPDLGPVFVIEAINKGNHFRTMAQQGAFSVRPGVYILKKKGTKASVWNASTPFGQISLGEFIAPAEQKGPTMVLHEPPQQLVEGTPWTVSTQIVSSDEPRRATLYVRRAGQKKFAQHQMQRKKGYLYKATLPADFIKAALLEYCVAVQLGEQVRTFPADVRGEPAEWDFPVVALWETLVVEKEAPVILFDARRDRDKLLFSHEWGGVPRRIGFVQGMTPSKPALRIDVPGFKAWPKDVSCQHKFGKELEGRRCDLGRFEVLRLRARSGQEPTKKFGIALIELDGTAWGSVIPLTSRWQEICIPLSKLCPMKVAKLPEGWPPLSRYWSRNLTGGIQQEHLRIQNITAVQISLGARFFPEDANLPHAIELESIILDAAN